MFDDDDDRIATAPMEQGMVPRRILFFILVVLCGSVCVCDVASVAAGRSLPPMPVIAARVAH